MNKFIRFYILPGAFFQSAVVAGGYGTGREVTEYITRYGAWGGLLACLAAIAVFTLILCLSFEFARINKAYNYHTFTQCLLGPGWIVYEILLVITMLLVTAVIAAASGDILADLFPVPTWLGTVLMLLMIIILNYYGRNIVIMALGVTSIAVTLVLVTFCILAITHQHELVAQTFDTMSVDNISALGSGATFALYNTIAFPALLYCVAGQESRRQTFTAGLVAGVFMVIPAVLLHLAFVANQSVLIDYEVPSYWMLKLIDIPWFTMIYLIVLFVTVTQSGVSVLHGVNERINEQVIKSRGKELSKFAQAMIAGSVVLVSGLLAQLGIIALIAQGYSMIAYGVLGIYLAPLLTWGVYRIFFSPISNSQ